jgi:hypothetical protein
MCTSVPGLYRYFGSMDRSIWFRSRKPGIARARIRRRLLSWRDRSQASSQDAGWSLLPGILRQDSTLPSIGADSDLYSPERRCSHLGRCLSGAGCRFFRQTAAAKDGGINGEGDDKSMNTQESLTNFLHPTNIRILLRHEFFTMTNVVCSKFCFTRLN